MIKCRYEGTGVWAERCLGTKEVDPCPGYEKCNRYKPDGLTNADRIRAMSDWELARFLCDLRKDCDECPAESFCYKGHTGMQDWLKQPAEGGLT